MNFSRGMKRVSLVLLMSTAIAFSIATITMVYNWSYLIRFAVAGASLIGAFLAYKVICWVIDGFASPSNENSNVSS